jgi:multisubunit Na+/H+ antiporter MnhG subunit
VLGRAGYRMGVPLWKGTVRDEWGRNQDLNIQEKTQRS